MQSRLLHLLLLLSSYAAVSAAAGIFLAEGTLHPARRALTSREKAWFHNIVYSDPVSIVANDGIELRAWSLRPNNQPADAVILLHGLGDNGSGMAGYAELLLKHGYSVLMPDARAHGVSGGELATYGWLERDDIRRWFEWLELTQKPPCIFGLGESMGAAQLLQSLETEPGFCAVVAESSFSNFREIAYDRAGQFFHTGPWLGRSILRPVVDVAFLYSRWKYGIKTRQISPEDTVAKSRVPVLLIHGALDDNIPLRHSERILARNKTAILWQVPRADHCGAISTAPAEFEARLISWFELHSSQPPTLKSYSALAKSWKPLLTSTKPHLHPQSPASAESSAPPHRPASISMLH
jgi:dipeptidyl aminopeptidase/acylaminoacyl peptidase